MCLGHFQNVIKDQKNSLNTEAVKQSSLVTASRPQVEPVGTVSMAQDDSSTTKQIGNNVNNQTVSNTILKTSVTRNDLL